MQPFSELHEVERRYEELAYKMSTPEAAADADAYAQMMRDYKELTPLMEEYRRYTALQKDEQEAKEVLMQQDSDPAFTAMVRPGTLEIAGIWHRAKRISACCSSPRMPMTKKASFWKFVPVRAAKKPRSLPTACGGCTTCTLPNAAGSARPSARTPPSWEA